MCISRVGSREERRLPPLSVHTFLICTNFLEVIQQVLVHSIMILPYLSSIQDVVLTIITEHCSASNGLNMKHNELLEHCQVYVTYTCIRSTTGLCEAKRCNVLSSGHLRKVLCLLFVSAIEQDTLEPN